MFTPEQKKIFFLICVVILIGSAVTVYKIHFQVISPDFIEQQITVQSDTQNIKQNEKILTQNASFEKTILVHIGGAVKFPGVYKLPQSIRALDALKSAGGVLSGADLDKVNLASKLKDGSRLYVPMIKNKITTKSNIQTKQVNTINFPIDINTATQTQLMSVPGIGAVMAQRIIQYRSTNGQFTTIQALTKVSGIGPKKLNIIRGYFK